MSFIGKIAKNALFGGLVGLGIDLFKKKPKASGLPPQASRDDARALADREAELARRRGAAGDIITGNTGAEAASGSIGRLVVGS